MKSVSPTPVSTPAVRSRASSTRAKSPTSSSKPSQSDLSLRSIVSAVLRGITETIRFVLSNTPVFVWVLLVGIVFAVVFIRAFQRAMSGPTVYRSWETKQCDHVVNDDGTAGDCAKIPTRYHNVWVY